MKREIYEKLLEWKSRSEAPVLQPLGAARLVGQLRGATGGIRGIGKVDKVYIDNPSLMTVLSGGGPNPGNLRETFFYNQMRVRNGIISSKDSDFVIPLWHFGLNF